MKVKDITKAYVQSGGGGFVRCEIDHEQDAVWIDDELADDCLNIAEFLEIYGPLYNQPTATLMDVEDMDEYIEANRISDEDE